MQIFADFAKKLAEGELLLGTWMKTPSPIVAEVLGQSNLDVICLDAEHAPFDRMALDGCVQVLRAAGKPVVIRLEANTPMHVMQALDYGAAGVLAAHVSTAEAARQLVRSAYFGPDGRGYAGSTRAAGYTARPMQDYLQGSRAETSVIAQIEDASALNLLDEIAAVEGLSCLFAGRVDLTVDLGAASVKDAEVMAAVAEICRAGKQAGKAVGMFLSDLSELPHWVSLGASFFLLESDHSFLLSGAGRLRELFDGMART